MYNLFDAYNNHVLRFIDKTSAHNFQYVVTVNDDKHFPQSTTQMPSILEKAQINGASEGHSKETRKSVHTIILDAGPILKNEPAISSLLASAEVLVTVPSIVAEIRDINARARIATTLLPFLVLKNPASASLKTVTEFARRTGDLAVLSKPDLLVLALAYELECERNGGDWRLRKLPGQKGLNGTPPPKQDAGSEIHSSETEGAPAADTTELCVTEKIGGDTVSKGDTQNESQDTAAGLDVIQAEEDVGNQIIHPASARPESTEESPVAQQAHLKGSDMAHPHDSVTPISEVAVELQHETESLSLEEVGPTEEALESDSSDSEGWITPSNIQKHKENDSNASAVPANEPNTIQVATITTDFAVQNVLLQMNLNLLSPSLQRVRHLKTWVLRCHACFKITKDMSKQFCPSCGGATLMRTSCSTDQNGVFKIHLKKNYQWNNRGNVYSIPKPVPGSASGKLNIGGGGKGGGKGGWGQELILREDQKEYVKAVQSEKKKKDRDLMDEDYLPSILTGERRPGGRRTVGAGRNVNSKKRK